MMDLDESKFGDASRERLRAALGAAVPLWIHQLRNEPFDQLQQRAARCSQIVAEKGDVILFRSKTAGESAAAFNALASGIACLAFAPGGVTFLGDHWSAP